MQLEAGSEIGPYRIDSPLGAGGMGQVYRAVDTRLDRVVAIKVLPPHVIEDPMAHARFDREAKSIAALSHPNVLAIFDIGSVGETPYIVTELLEGETLRLRLMIGPIPWRRAIEIGAAIADGLAAAHAKGIIHRDLKPENVFLTADGRVKILDFGLAKPLPSAQAGGDDRVTDVLSTSPGFVMGTLGYVSPEQLRGEEPDERSDLFALGCTLYEMLTARSPFQRDTSADSMAAVIRDAPAELPEAVAATVPTEVQQIVRRCLEKNRDERFQSSRDLSFALRSISSSALDVVPPRATRPQRWLPLLLFLALLGAGIVYFWDSRAPALSIRGQKIRSLAVLPFENSGKTAEDEYLSDGITESLTNGLSQLSQLSVMSSSTAFRYKGKELNPPSIGKQLRVDALLIGRLARRGENLHVSAELVDSRNGRHIWGRQYDLPRTDLINLPGDVARRISQELRLELSGAQEKRLQQRATDDPEAYHSYLKGRYAWNKRTPEGFAQAIEFFEQAIERDPSYALAYAGLADSYTLQALYGQASPNDVLPKARAAATRALEADPDLAEAVTSLAYFRRNYDRDLGAAEAEFRKAITLNPNYATARHWHALCLADMGRTDDAIDEIKRAAALDPLSPVIYADYAGILNDADRVTEAEVEIRKALELDPRFPFAHHIGAEIELRRGNAGAAVKEAQLAWELGKDPRTLLRLGQAHLLAGDRDKAVEVLGSMERLSRERFVSPHTIARLAAAAGEKEKAFLWLERAGRALPPGALSRSLERDPLFAPLRTDPRFSALAAEVAARAKSPRL